MKPRWGNIAFSLECERWCITNLWLSPSVSQSEEGGMKIATQGRACKITTIQAVAWPQATSVRGFRSIGVQHGSAGTLIRGKTCADFPFGWVVHSWFGWVGGGRKTLQRVKHHHGLHWEGTWRNALKQVVCQKVASPIPKTHINLFYPKINGLLFPPETGQNNGFSNGGLKTGETFFFPVPFNIPAPTYSLNQVPLPSGKGILGSCLHVWG